MNIRHFCYTCKVQFHRAIDFVKHKHEIVEDIEPFIALHTLTPDRDPEYWKDNR